MMAIAKKAAAKKAPAAKKKPAGKARAKKQRASITDRIVQLEKDAEKQLKQLANALEKRAKADLRKAMDRFEYKWLRERKKSHAKRLTSVQKKAQAKLAALRKKATAKTKAAAKKKPAAKARKAAPAAS
jgi:hypothetical protein